MKLTDEEKKLQLQGSQLREMTETQGWSEVLIPHLESVIRNSWVDPRTFKNDKEYSFAMRTAWAMAKASDEIIDFIEKTIEEGIAMGEKQKGKVDPLREAMS
ncbi:hypothetical protein M0R04_15530 [Candidatus Dojkabacteria bacterium]|jgi:hypothetical protein|nr:hypothetical protein [Candidatus Dojkabacteria bacterium]